MVEATGLAVFFTAKFAGASLATSLAGAGAIATGAGVAGAGAGAVANAISESKKEKHDKDVREEGFEDGVKKGKVLSVEEIKKYVDFCLATTALSYLCARCDGSIAEEELWEINQDLDAVKKNCDIAPEVQKELDTIAKKEDISFDFVKNYLDNVSIDTLKRLSNDINEIIKADGTITIEEREVVNKFNDYFENRCK